MKKTTWEHNQSTNIQINYLYDSQIAKVTIEKKFLQLLQETYASPDTIQGSLTA